MKKYHYCIMRNVTRNPEYRSGVIVTIEDIYSPCGYRAIKKIIGSEERPTWEHEDFVILSLSPLLDNISISLIQCDTK